jgi:hypothetical protein
VIQLAEIVKVRIGRDFLARGRLTAQMRDPMMGVRFDAGAADESG